MATLEEFGVLVQLSNQLFGLARNMRQNAQHYTAVADAIDGGTAGNYTVPTLADEMHRDGQQFESRLATITALATRNQPLVQNALAIIGVTLASANATKNGLVTVARHVQAAPLATTQACRDEAAFVLANVPAYDGMF